MQDISISSGTDVNTANAWWQNTASWSAVGYSRPYYVSESAAVESPERESAPLFSLMSQRFTIMKCSRCFASQICKQIHNISVNADRPVLDFLRRVGFAEIQAGVKCVRVLESHSPEREFDDSRGVHSHAEFKE